MESVNINFHESKKKLLGYFKRFFGFGENPDFIRVILPQVEQNRTPSLICNNYPRYSYAISPDDVFTALRVYSKLVLLYGNKVQVESSKECILKPSGHLILIGSPVTNPFSSNVLKDQYYNFGSGKNDHDIFSRDGEKKYTVVFDDESTSLEERNIIRDYSLISKRSIYGIVQVVLAGCRAYGQLALWDILESIDFYEQTLPKVEEKNFQLLIEVNVIGRTCKDWRILDRKISKKGD